MSKEATAQELNTDRFINEKINEIKGAVGDGIAINALSGGVDSSTVTMLGHRALGNRLKTMFIENGLMREGEPEQVAGFFRKFGITIEVVDARKEFFTALKGITDPEEKREAIAQTFYQNVFGRIVKESGAKYLLQGTILTDIDETVAGIKRQHNSGSTLRKLLATASLSRSFSFARMALERLARRSGFRPSYSIAFRFRDQRSRHA